MPELPEVEVVKRGLAPHLPGRVITHVRTDGKALRFPVPLIEMMHHLPGEKISAVHRRAKYLIIETETGTLLIIHLGMTGKLGLFPAETPETLHDHAAWLLDNGMELRFNDVRRFGSISLLQPAAGESLEDTFFKSTGPEPFDPGFTPDYLLETARNKSKPVKNFIMDNHVVAGVGNIYANESLHAAGIRPTRPAGSLNRKKWAHLIASIRKILEEAISCGGSTISDFIGASGQRGYFQINFSVYGRSGELCNTCRNTIVSQKIGGRASFYCPSCQR